VTVPLSLTTSHCLLIRVGAHTYALPIETVQRILSVNASDIQILEGRSALVLDSRPVQLTHLAEVLGGQFSPGPISAGSLALLLGGGERQVACLVDAVLGDQEVLLQRLPAPLQHVPLIAGATLLASGGVVPVLDVVDLLQAAMRVRRLAAAPMAEEFAQRIPTVLVVDDSITTRTLEKNILESAGYRVRLATDGIEALQVLDQLADDGGCDLLLSDVDMPRLNGFELTSAVRANQRFHHLPVVLMTSLDTPEDRERGVTVGADSYVVKRSFDQQALLGVIARLI
jgi:two-component system chemotaxis sensor kinase CheA